MSIRNIIIEYMARNEYMAVEIARNEYSRIIMKSILNGGDSEE
jgi:hypothetical protein